MKKVNIFTITKLPTAKSVTELTPRVAKEMEVPPPIAIILGVINSMSIGIADALRNPIEAPVSLLKYSNLLSLP